MFLPSRSDGIPVSGESTLRRLMPYILPRRNDAVVYFEQKIEVTKLLQYLENRQAQNMKPEVTLFQVLMTGMMRANYHWPKMNRFVAGKNIYQRKLTALDELKKSLLHRAFNGEL